LRAHDRPARATTFRPGDLLPELRLTDTPRCSVALGAEEMLVAILRHLA